MRLVWLLLVLVAVSDVGLGEIFLDHVAPVNCNSGDAAVCIESLFFLE